MPGGSSDLALARRPKRKTEKGDADIAACEEGGMGRKVEGRPA